ncbi:MULTISPECIES: hypothetical protein [Streptomyces]
MSADEAPLYGPGWVLWHLRAEWDGGAVAGDGWAHLDAPESGLSLAGRLIQEMTGPERPEHIKIEITVRPVSERPV